jgi:hypothetical protein
MHTINHGKYKRVLNVFLSIVLLLTMGVFGLVVNPILGEILKKGVKNTYLHT